MLMSQTVDVHSAEYALAQDVSSAMLVSLHPTMQSRDVERFVKLIMAEPAGQVTRALAVSGFLSPELSHTSSTAIMATSAFL
eukprot:2849164-Amphidinium_carterae.1